VRTGGDSNGIATGAWAVVDITVETLFAVFGSEVAVVTLAVLLTVAPASTRPDRKTTDNVAVDPAGSSTA